MSYQTLRYEVKDAVATLTLDRPDAYNALNLTWGASCFMPLLRPTRTAPSAASSSRGRGRPSARAGTSRTSPRRATASAS